MKYDNVITGRFLGRLNRFVAQVEIDGFSELCHVKNTGRLKELLIPGTKCIVQKITGRVRKTNYSLLSVYKDNQLVNIDSQAPNQVAKEYLPQIIPSVKLLKSEVKFANSRFDIYLETDTQRYFVEVKGVTLEKDGVAMFPDAPTERGVKHLHELGLALKEGYQAIVLFVIQMKGCRYFSPNKEMHKAFAEKLKEVKEQGVQILAVDCLVTPDELKAADPLEVVLF